MTRVKAPLVGLFLSVAGFLSGGIASAADIRGTISTTLTITEDSQLVGDVTCTMTGTPCIAFGASGVTLNLNNFSMTGQADPTTGCSGGQTANEVGILINGGRGNIIQGPGVVQRVRASGITISGGSSLVLVKLVTS
jgi:hypothetical protein